MKVTIGTTVLAAGTAGGEPSRFASSSASKQVQLTPRLRASKPALVSRGNRSYVDVIEADFSYATPQLAKAGIVSRRVAALSATGTLKYDTGDDETSVGTAEVRGVELVEWVGCGFTLRFEIVSVEA